MIVQPLQVENGGPLDLDLVAQALERSGLGGLVAARGRWQTLESLVAMPWNDTPCS
ncbi:MAG: hypothetical protein ACKO0M_17640 [Cyanobium sp.]